MFGWVSHMFCVWCLFWVERHKNSHDALVCVLCACVVCSLDGVCSGRVNTLLGCGGTGTVVWFFLLLFLFVNSGREHLMNDRRDCLLLCVIWFAARFVSVVSV